MFEDKFSTENPQFIRVHKSYIVNFNRLISINENQTEETIVMTQSDGNPAFILKCYELIL